MVRSAIVLLAGGEARRFPGKLAHPVDGRPMLALVYERVRAAGWPVYIAGKGSFARELDAKLDAPLVIDRRSGGGPLSALLATCSQIRAERVFAVAADQPRLDANLLRRLDAAWQPGDEAVVPEHGGGIEPLAAAYERRALLREGFELRATGSNGLRDVIARVAARFVPCDAGYFHNVNRIEDLP
jgi:molybdopterin-guanine dinucleotide biosynthesis protein A